MRMRDLLRAAKRRCRERRCSCRVLRTQGTSEQVPRGARWREMRMNARRTKPPVQRRLMRAQRALSREAAAVATKVVVRTTTEEAGAAGAAFSRQPFGTGLAGALALSRGSHTNPRFALLRAIIPGKLPVAPARDLFRGSLVGPEVAAHQRRNRRMKRLARRFRRDERGHGRHGPRRGCSALHQQRAHRLGCR